LTNFKNYNNKSKTQFSLSKSIPPPSFDKILEKEKKISSTATSGETNFQFLSPFAINCSLRRTHKIQIEDLNYQNISTPEKQNAQKLKR